MRRCPSPLALLGASAALLVPMGCQGTIGSNSWTPPDTEYRSGEVDFVCDEAATETPSVMRRLSRTQLQHMVQDTVRRLLPEAEAGDRDIEPGTLLDPAADALRIACGENGREVLRVTKLQMPGGKPLAARDLLLAHFERRDESTFCGCAP